jgi:hypothetical protein
MVFEDVKAIFAQLNTQVYLVLRLVIIYIEINYRSAGFSVANAG